MNPNEIAEMPCAAQSKTVITDLPDGIIAIGHKNTVIRNRKYIDADLGV